MSFGQELRSRRRQMNLSQAELGEKIGVNQGTVSAYEKDAARPSFECLIKISKVLKCTVDDLVSGCRSVSD